MVATRFSIWCGNVMLLSLEKPSWFVKLTNVQELAIRGLFNRQFGGYIEEEQGVQFIVYVEEFVFLYYDPFSVIFYF